MLARSLPRSPFCGSPLVLGGIAFDRRTAAFDPGVLVVVSSSFLGRGTPCPTVGRSAASVERVTAVPVVPLCLL